MTEKQVAFEEIRLSAADNAVNAAAVVADPGQHLGLGAQAPPPELPTDVRGAYVTLRIGERPLALDLEALYTAAKLPLPNGYTVASPHRLCLLLNTIQVLNEGSYERIRRIGLRIQLPDDRRIRIFDLFPRPELICLVEGSLTCQADVHMDGQAEIPTELQLGKDLLHLPFDVDVSVQAGVGGHLVGRLSFAVYSQAVAAVGVGDSQAQWVLSRQSKPLDGRWHLFGLIVSAPKEARALMLQANVYAVVANLSTLYTWPIRLQQPGWKKLPVRIQETLSQTDADPKTRRLTPTAAS